MRTLSIYFFTLILFLCLSHCSGKSIKTTSSTIDPEEKAIQNLALEIYGKYELLKAKKIGIFDFTTLEGKDIPAGKRLAKKLLEELIKKGSLKFVERSEIAKVLKAQGIEQTGIVDQDTLKKAGKILPIDVMINGTVANLGNQGEISIKIVDIASGEIYLASSEYFSPREKFVHREKPKILNLYQKNPEKLQILNRAFFSLNRLSRERPLIFLLAVLHRDEINIIKRENPRLIRHLSKRREIIRRRNPNLKRKIFLLREGLGLLRRFDPERFEMIMEIKRGLLSRIIMEGGKRRPVRRR